jgi:uncharacterized glyoxalase superfamily protein PhnB
VAAWNDSLATGSTYVVGTADVGNALTCTVTATSAYGGSSATSSPVIYVVIDDPDAHHERAQAAGAEIVRGLTDEDYGSREYSARDLEGNLWSFGTYDPYDVN